VPVGARLIDVVVAESPYRSPASGMLDILTAFLRLMPPWLASFTLLRWLAPVIVRFALGKIRRQGPEPLIAVEDVIDRVPPRPVFLIHGTFDNRFRPAHSVALYERLKGDAHGIAATPPRASPPFDTHTPTPTHHTPQAAPSSRRWVHIPTDGTPGASCAELWIVPGACHTEVYDHGPAEYTQRVLAFLARSL
jgi:fermentation-respiration switch protein FrsA (DUF1100 family)